MLEILAFLSNPVVSHVAFGVLTAGVAWYAKRHPADALPAGTVSLLTSLAGQQQLKASLGSLFDLLTHAPTVVPTAPPLVPAVPAPAPVPAPAR